MLTSMINKATTLIRNPPIVEAVFDVECDLPPGVDLAALAGPSHERFGDRYPKFREQFLRGYRTEVQAELLPKMSTQLGVQAFQFLQDDERQLVQLRAQGFSFNRLAPYSSLDDYLPEIERTWRLYADLVSPVQIRVVRLRYINRILVPMTENSVDLDEFLNISPRLQDEESWELSSFLNQHVAIEKETGNQLNLVLSVQLPVNERLPVILDITVASASIAEPADWSNIFRLVGSLRSLKNRIFLNTLTPKCIELFQS
jgi:uncharacterized protein (TIGR04255 family)